MLSHLPLPCHPLTPPTPAPAHSLATQRIPPLCVPQAKKLDEMLSKKGETIDKVLNFVVPDSLLVDRVTGRWIHPASGRSYHEKVRPGAPQSKGVRRESRVR